MAPPTIARRFGYFATFFCAAFLLTPLLSPFLGRRNPAEPAYNSPLSYHGMTDLDQMPNALPGLGTDSPWSGTSSASPCVLDKKRLEDLHLADDFEYSCQQIHALPQRNKQTVLPVPVDRQLWSIGQHYSLSQVGEKGISTSAQEKPFELITTVESQSTDGSSFVFGVATDADRLLSRIPQLSHWLAYSNATMIAILPDTDVQRVPEVKEKLGDIGVRIQVFTSSDDFLTRYFGMTEAFGKMKQPHHKWFVFTDDDTFFLSFTRLSKLLKKYDPSEKYYIGAVTEDFRMMGAVRMIAFGGAGVIVSTALLDELYELYPICRKIEGPGDYRLGQCIYQNTQTKITLEYSLRQGDLLGDARGLIESGRPMTSLHHWNAWYRFDIEKLATASKACTTGCIAERFQFRSPHPDRKRAVLVNGASITEYANDAEIDFKKMERTWNIEPGSNFDHSLTPLREPLKEGEGKFTYILDGAWIEDGVVNHVFVRRDRREDAKKKKDDVIHLMWI